MEGVKNLTDQIKVVFDAAKPWINYDLWKAEQTEKKTRQAPSSTFLDELRKKGASPEELKDFQEEQDRLSTEQQQFQSNDDQLVASDEYDPPPVVIG